MRPEILTLLTEISALSELEAVKLFISRNAAAIEGDSILAAVVNGKLAELAGFTASRLEKSAERAEENASETAAKKFAKFRRLGIATKYARNLLASMSADGVLPKGGTITITFDDRGTGREKKVEFDKLYPSLSRHLSNVKAEDLVFLSVDSVKVTMGIARYDENGRRVRKMRKVKRDSEGKAELVTVNADIPENVEA